MSHKHLTAGLERFGAAHDFIKIVENLYEGACTKFTTSKGTIGSIRMTRGVKQGDPLSPLLFNIAMDPLISEITAQGNGNKFGKTDSERIESLAYADDNCVLTGSVGEMNHNLAIVNSFCAGTGMKLNVKKSAAFSIIPKGNRSYVVNDCPEQITVGGEKVPLINPSESIKYLGSKISPWVNKLKSNLFPSLDSMLKGIDKSSLRPRQKLVILEQYALPRLMFPLTQEHHNKGELLDLDRRVRAQVKKWLHLPDSTCNGLFHSRRADGGLGLPEFVRSVPAQRINNLRALKNSSDPKIRRLADVMSVDNDISKYATMADIKVPRSSKRKAQ